jgi:multidrug efflux pump subunit AcrA (membrane-fusion protein)
LRVKGTTYRVTFTMSAEDAQKARQLGFCRVEIEGKPIDCSLSAEGGDETRVVIDLPNDAVVAAGKAARLSRDRMEGVFNLPASAVEKVGDSHRLYVVVGGGPGLPTRAEPRVIAVAASSDTHVVVSQGIDVGDRVIVDRPPGLKADDRVMLSDP